MGAWFFLGRAAGGWAGRNPKPVLAVLGAALWLSQGDACIEDDALGDDGGPAVTQPAPWLDDTTTTTARETAQ